jgi:glycosyltransferase involved in cell wall biosynthesis
MKKKRFLFFVKNFNCGIKNVVNTLLNLDNKGYDGWVVVIEKGCDIIKKKEKIIYLDKRTPNYNFNLKKIYLFIKDLVKGFFIIKKYRPNFIIASGVYSITLIAILKKIKSDIETIYLIGDLYFDLIQEKNISKIYKKIMSFSLILALKTGNYLVFSSKLLRNDFIHNYSLKDQKNLLKKSVVIHHGIPKKIIQKKHKTINKSKEIKLISVGRLTKKKDFYTVIKAFYLVLNKYKKNNINLTIIGDGEEKEKLLLYTKKLKLEKKIRFIGWKNNIFPYLKQSDIFLFSSLYDGFGYVLIEAMSQGLPVVSTDTPFGPREILDNGKYGVLVPMKDPQVMAEAINKLISNVRIYSYYSKISLKRVLCFAEENMVSKYIKLFRYVNSC